MNCPKCGKPMEAGSVYSNRWLFWTSDRTKLRNFHRPSSSFRLRPVGDHTRSVFSLEALNTIPQYSADLCRACGTVIVSVEPGG